MKNKNIFISILFLVHFILLINLSYTQSTNISGVINKYTIVNNITISPCLVNISVSDTTNFRPGDTIIIMQMQGAKIDTTNTATFGNIIDYNKVGNYELLIINNRIGNNLYFNTTLISDYDINGKVQLIKGSFYHNANINALLTASPWDGYKGGVLFINVKDTLIFNNNINLNGLGYRGGNVFTSTGAAYGSMNYFYNNISSLGANKGEGIKDTTIIHKRGRGANGNGGGGGNDHNSGGAGGGNGGKGGRGGYQNSDTFTIVDNGGRGGNNINYTTFSNKLIMGGGGGSGHQNAADLTGTSGKNGGGIIIINAKYIKGNNQYIYNNGLDQTLVSNADGAGGGGAGGSILINSNDYLGSPLNIYAKGGKGGDTRYNVICVGTGGGGGGGALITSSVLPSYISTNLLGGIAGRHTINLMCGNHGALNGDSGIILLNTNPLRIPTSTVIRSFDTTICFGDSVLLDFIGTADSFRWMDGSNVRPRIVNTSNNFILTTYNTCGTTIDTFNVRVLPLPVSINLREDTIICIGDSIIVGFTSIVDSFRWSNGSTTNPIYLNSAGTYYVSAYSGCGISRDTIHITNVPNIFINPFDTTICYGDSVLLDFIGTVDSFRWMDGSNVRPRIVNTSNNFILTTYNTCGTTIDTFNVRVLPLPVSINLREDTIICNGDSILVGFTSIVDSFRWSNGSTTNPIYINSAGTYYVSAYSGCGISRDTIHIANAPNIYINPFDTTICYGDSVLLDFIGTVDSFRWMDGINVRPRIVNTSNNYILTTYNLCGTSIDNFNVRVLPLPVSINLREDTIICIGDSILVGFTSIVDSFRWSNGSTTNPIYINSAGTYHVSAYSGCGISRDTVNVFLDSCIKDTSRCKVAIPSAFSPNADGVNDFFNVFTNCNDITNFNIQIFNRWGELVFESNDIYTKWDGTYKGRDQLLGVYVYKVTFRSYLYSNNKDILLKGNVTLIR